MTKEEVKNKYLEVCKLLGTKHLTRKQFIKNSKISERQILKFFDGFNNLKFEAYAADSSNSQVSMIEAKGKNLQFVLDTCGIDQNLWEVDQFTTKELKEGEFLFTVYFKKKKVLPDLSKIIQEITNISPVVKPIQYVEGELLAEINLADLHVGKLCDAREVGHNYDIKIASKIFREAIEYKIQQLKKYNVGKILFVIGNDFLHVDSLESTTTSGTKQDSDGRYYKMFEEGSKLLIEAVTRFSEIAPVDCYVICGNHSKLGEFALGSILQAYFHNNSNITINNEPTPRKYYRFGKCLIGLCHGDEVKLQQLPMLMAQEAKKDWGETSYKFIRCGHFHHQKVILEEMTGCLVETLSSLSGTDAWHKKKGFCNNLRAAQTALYDKEKGLITKIYFNL